MNSVNSTIAKIIHYFLVERESKFLQLWLLLHSVFLQKKTSYCFNIKRSQYK